MQMQESNPLRFCKQCTCSAESQSGWEGPPVGCSEAFTKRKGVFFFKGKKTILRQARCWCLWVYLAGITSLLLDTWCYMDICLSLSLSMWDRLPFQFWHLCLFVLHLTISSNFEIWLDLIPLISYNWSLASFFLPKQSHTHNFTTIPKRHLNPNPKKIPPKRFSHPLWGQSLTSHQPSTNPSPTHQLPYHPYHPEKKTQFSSSCSSKAHRTQEAPRPRSWRPCAQEKEKHRDKTPKCLPSRFADVFLFFGWEK